MLIASQTIRPDLKALAANGLYLAEQVEVCRGVLELLCAEVRGKQPET